jgi:serpin B
MALSISYAGAKGNTSSELKDLLSFNLSDLEMFKQSERYLNTFFDIKNTSNYSLNLANKIYPKKDKEFSLNKNYSDLIKKYFKVDIQAINFTEKNAAAGIVNKWVSSKTANKINNILNPDLITKETRVILANAIYFKGFWVTKFDSGLTKKTPFNLANGNKKDVDMMYIRNTMFSCLTDIADLEASACVFPYEGDSVSMTIILPNKNSSLSKLENKLDINKLRNVLNAKKTPSMIDVYIPKFKIEFKSDVSLEIIKDCFCG